VLPLLLALDDCEVIDKVSNCPLKEEVSDTDSDKDFRLASLDIDDWDSSSSCCTCDKTSLKIERKKLICGIK
jgi:hypothetical protein